MFKNALIAASIAAAAVSSAVPTPAQQQITPEDLQQMRQQALDRLQQQGIDPQQMADQVRQQIQDGSFNPQQFMQQLQQQGIIDPNMMNRFQGGMQQAVLNGLRAQLAVTDEEWAVLSPLLQKLVDAKAVADVGMSAGGGGFGGGFGGFGGFGAVNPNQADNPVSRALTDLQAAVASPETPTVQLNVKLQVLRDARLKARVNLQNVREELRKLLTVRQEAILLTVGYLD